jgi:type IV pilus assembly protein PilN
MRVSGSRDRAIELVRNLEKSRHFATPHIATETLATASTGAVEVQQVNANGDVNFDILADYRPLSSVETKSAVKDEPAAAPIAPKPPKLRKPVKGYIAPNPSPAGGVR